MRDTAINKIRDAAHMASAIAYRANTRKLHWKASLKCEQAAVTFRKLAFQAWGPYIARAYKGLARLYLSMSAHHRQCARPNPVLLVRTKAAA